MDTKNQKKPSFEEITKAAQHKLDNLVKPMGSMGKLEDIALKLCQIYGTLSPKIEKEALIVMCGDHGVAKEKVASAPQEVTIIQSINISKGLSCVGALAKGVGAQVYTVDIGIDADQKFPELIDRRIKRGTDNIKVGPAMTREEAQKSIDVGIEMATKAVKEGANILAIGEMGIGNTTPTTAITALLAGADPSSMEDILTFTGIGANFPTDMIPHKAKVIQEALLVNAPNKKDGLDILSKVGGLEIGGMAGVILGAHKLHVPVIIDGYISTAAALIAALIEPECKKNIIPSHKSKEKGAKTASDLLGVDPYLDMNLRLGEGTGAVLTFSLCRSACTMINDMATFGQSGIEIF